MQNDSPMQYGSFEDDNLAITKFESMLKTNSVFFFDSQEFENIIQYYLELGKVALARKAIKLGLEQHPSNTILKLLQIELLIFESKLDAAEKLLDQLYEVEPNNDEVFIQKASILSKRDEHEKAIDCLRIALSYTDDPSDVHSLLGMEYLFLDQYGKAKECFMACLQDDEQDYSALYNVIYCFDYLQDADGAISFLNDFLERNPYCEVAWHQLGKQFIEKEMLKEALSSFDFAVICDDSFVGAYLEKGKILEQLGRYNEALEQYEITLQLDDPTSFAYLRMGLCHQQLGNHKIAMELFKKTIHEDPLLDKGWLAITDYHIEQKNFQKAKYYVNKAINIDSENVAYWKRSAVINTALNFLEEADLAYKKTIELGNYELQTWLMWAKVQHRLGETEDAIHTLLQATEFYPDNTEVSYHLAGLYYSVSQPVKAQFHLKNGLMGDYEGHTILSRNFPKIYNRNSVKNIITSYRKSSAS